MINTVILASLAAYIMLTPSSATANAPTSEWYASVDAWVEDLEATHPDPYRKVGRLTFLRAVEQFKDEIETLSEEERMVGLMRINALLGDGHTVLVPSGKDWHVFYPFRVIEYEDGYFVTSVHRSQADLAGAELLTVSGVPIKVVANAVRALQSADNQFGAQVRIFPLMNSRLMRGLGYAASDGSIDATFRLKSGEQISRRLEGMKQTEDWYLRGGLFVWQFPSEVYGLGIGSDENWIAAFGDTPSNKFKLWDASRPVHLTIRNRYFYRALPEKDAFYIQLNQTDDGDMIDFFDEALAKVDAQRPKRLIVDLRGNFGGDSSRAAEMVRKFVHRGPDFPWEEFYLIVGPKTFSAGINLMQDFRRELDLTLVGAPPGAPINFYGDSVGTYYGAGFAAGVSALWHQSSASSDIRSHLSVDVPAVWRFSDYLAGQDPAVDPILDGKEMRSLTEIIRAEGGSAARRTYAERKQELASLGWWEPPTEVELRAACRSLSAEGRHEEALEACRLTTEIHPFIWNSWYNLADTQENMGLSRERLSSYACVLALDPTNFNAPVLRPLIEGADHSVTVAPDCPVQP